MHGYVGGWFPLLTGNHVKYWKCRGRFLDRELQVWEMRQLWQVVEARDAWRMMRRLKSWLLKEKTGYFWSRALTPNIWAATNNHMRWEWSKLAEKKESTYMPECLNWDNFRSACYCGRGENVWFPIIKRNTLVLECASPTAVRQWRLSVCRYLLALHCLNPSWRYSHSDFSLTYLLIYRTVYVFVLSLGIAPNPSHFLAKPGTLK